MSIVPFHVIAMLDRLRATFTVDGVRGRLSAKRVPAVLGWPRRMNVADEATIRERWTALKAQSQATANDEDLIADQKTVDSSVTYARNIENMIGTVKVPVGVVGPLRVNGLAATGDYMVPLATTEAALVASYARGAAIVTRAGGASAAVLADGVLRSPGFIFASLADAGVFVDWVTRVADDLKAAAETTTRFGKLVMLEPVIDNDVVFLLCRYTTGDASGQNMVTIATDALCRRIEATSPVRPLRWFIEANFSGDKKASYLGLRSGRGRKVTASVTVPAELVEKQLHTTVACMLDYARIANLGALMSGQIGAQGHYANALAAFYIATGQDAACVAESAVGLTRMEARDAGLFVSVTLPNILVGSVGGGTGLPSQQAALRLMGLAGSGHGQALAEVVASLCLAGEISIIGAISAGHFSRAHQKLARDR